MSAGHTPGPWVTQPKLVHQDFVEIQHTARHFVGASSLNLARVTCRTAWFDEQMANARLIAAAPDLLEALQRLIPHAHWMESCSCDDDGINRDIERARAAIYKAEGLP